MKFTQLAFKVTQASSGTTCLTPNDWVGSITSNNYALLNPVSAGGRFADAAALFQFWRLVNLTLEYFPDMSGSGILENVAGGTTTPTYGSRTFAIGFQKDPATSNFLSPMGFSEIVAQGGRISDTSRSFRMRGDFNGKWLYTNDSATSPTIPLESRFTAACSITSSFFTNSTTAAATYGFIRLSFTAQFKTPINDSAPQVALSAPQAPSPNEYEEKKIDGDVWVKLKEIGKK
jgi:hypothetical protein